jgi:abhydrolase domain-containing protein 17
MFEPSHRRPLALRPAVILGLIGLMTWSASVACLWTYESTLIFQAHRTRFPSALASEGLLQLWTDDAVQLDALSLTHEHASRYWILFCLPSAETIHSPVRRQLELLHAWGYNVLAIDYRGFGRNRGTPSEAGVYEDALTAYRYLTEQLDVAPDWIRRGSGSGHARAFRWLASAERD